MLSQEPVNIDSMNNLVHGRWIWTSCYGGISGTCYENPKPNDQRAIIFEKTTTDSILFKVYRNDTLILSGITKLQYTHTPFLEHWIIDKDVVHGGEHSIPVEYYILNVQDTNEIEFIQPCIDCYYYIYEKDTITMGANPIESTQDLIAFPNPSAGILFIKNNSHVTYIELIDISGKVILKRSLFPTTERIVIDITNMKKGLYFIRLTSDEGTKIQKLIKL